MYRIFRHYIPKTLLILGATEALILLVSIYLGVTVRLIELQAAGIAPGVGLLQQALVTSVVFAAVMMSMMFAMGLYQRDLRDGPRGILFRLCLSFALGFGVMAVIYRLLPGLMVGNGAFMVALACAGIGIGSCRFLAYQRTASLLSRRVLVLGAGEKAQQIVRLRRRSDRVGVDMVGFVALGTGPVLVPEAQLLPVQTNLVDLVGHLDVDEIVVAVDDRRKTLPINEILECKMRGVAIVEDSDFFERQLGKIRLDGLNPSNVFFADGFSQAALKASSKRLFDVVVAAAGLLFAAPLMVLTAAAIYLESGGPVIYRQQRVGKGGRPFDVYKFRSMRTDAEKDGQARWATQNDDRITAVGRTIRKIRFDELPQLVNVLKGDMSFVGPRPERPQFVEELSREIPYYALRHHVKPGITGWAQICYPYGSSIADAKEKLQYDLYYLKNYSIFLDLTILLHTVEVVLWGKGSR
ncbi:MAG: TIGR03013 family XrtA/PEP-CTERM system glycosyltransferase [Gammaproteobacteria bacterium]